MGARVVPQPMINRDRRGHPWLLAILIEVLPWLGQAGEPRASREPDENTPPPPVARLTRNTNDEMVITLETAAQQRLDLQVARVEISQRPLEVRGFGRVLDPLPLRVAQSEIVLAAAALTNSEAQFQRARILNQADAAVSRRAYEAAEAQFRADEIRANALRLRLVGEWGEWWANLDPKARGQLLDQLARRTEVLIRVDLPLDVELKLPVRSARLLAVGGSPVPLDAVPLGPAPAVDARLLGRAFLLRAENPGAALAPGMAVTVWLRSETGSASGVEVSRSSVVRAEGKTWVYCQTAPTAFTRRRITLDHPTLTGWFVREGWTPNDRVVVRGAQMLLSEEQKSTIPMID